MKTWHWVALAVVVGGGYLFLRAYTGGGGISLGGPQPTPGPTPPLLGLPDPQSVPLGTRIGNYMTTQNRLQGSKPVWTFAGYGGGVPGMLT